MKFWITIQHDRKTYNYEVEQIEKTASIEKYRVNGRNGSVVFQNNRPVFIKRNLKHRRPDWKMVEGEIRYRSFAELIVDAINNYLKNNPNL